MKLSEYEILSYLLTYGNNVSLLPLVSLEGGEVGEGGKDVLVAILT